jgi:hypothetical protein
VQARDTQAEGEDILSETVDNHLADTAGYSLAGGSELSVDKVDCTPGREVDKADWFPAVVEIDAEAHMALMAVVDRTVVHSRVADMAPGVVREAWTYSSLNKNSICAE